jgi:chromosome segregation protein
MKIRYIEMSGFRAFRVKTRVDMGPGFAVITGRNGSGKSTVCDALEYILTGSIRASSRHKEKGESIDDYIWWRGPGAATDKHVEICFSIPGADDIIVRRSPAGLALGTQFEGDLESIMLDGNALLDRPLERLCRTTILRDEEITRLSVDLSEIDRFDFVRAALGTADFSAAEEKTKKVLDALKRLTDNADQEYRAERERIADLTGRLSLARSEALRASGVDNAEKTLASYLPTAQGPSRLSQLERAIAAERLRIDSLGRVLARLDQLIRLRNEVTTSQYKQKLIELATQLTDAHKASAAARAAEEQVNTELAAAQAESPRIASIAQLHAIGARLGLQDGKCPLCGSVQTKEQFNSHLNRIRNQLDSANAALSRTSTQAATAAAENTRLALVVADVTRRVDEIRRSEAAATSQLPSIAADLSRLGVTMVDDPQEAANRLRQDIEALRTRLARIEEAVAVLRASQAATRVVELEREVAAANESLAAAERRVSRASSAQSRAKDAQNVIKRAQGEFVDTQLAELSPLLIELYQRLRPHVDWTQVRYHLRGDVRKMLSVIVGADINPSFVFSSGQRRAAGLAFLLAIHLSRSWCKLMTLLLDDPVQHVDDYRALHLTEVLAAIRRSGRQIICTVEDQALADLLARRLRSDVGGEGRLIELKYHSGSGGAVVSEKRLAPLTNRVLIAS